MSLDLLAYTTCPNCGRVVFNEGRLDMAELGVSSFRCKCGKRICIYKQNNNWMRYYEKGGDVVCEHSLSEMFTDAMTS